MELKVLMTWGSILAAVIAAIFWLISAVVKKKATPQGQVPELGLELVDNRGIDLVETNAAQSRWSAWAAFAAAIAAIFQAIATYLSQIPTA